ncbi:MAG: tyrosine-type recombinase/integrase [Mycobacteriales bacterium]
MSKRADGEGTVHQRKSDGLWEAQVVLPARGLLPRRRVSVYGKTQKQALERMRLKVAEHQSGIDTSARPLTLAQYGRQHFEVTMRAEVDRGNNAESTLRNYRALWDKHIVPTLGHVRLNELTPAGLRQWLAGLCTQQSTHSQQPLAAATQQRIYGVLRVVLNAAYRDEVIRENPLHRVKPPRGGSAKVQPLTPQEMDALLTQVEGHRVLHMLVVLMALTGARSGEALAASWTDIDLDAARWHISRQLTRLPTTGRAGSKTVLGTTNKTKTRDSNATIMLPQVVVALLRRHRAAQSAERLAARRWADADLVFCTPVGTLLEPRNVRRDFHAATAAAGITRNVRLHDLRHTAASSLLAEDVSIERTSKLLRHTRLATTHDLYTHLLEETRAEAAEAMDRRYARLLAPPSG